MLPRHRIAGAALGSAVRRILGSYQKTFLESKRIGAGNQASACWESFVFLPLLCRWGWQRLDLVSLLRAPAPAALPGSARLATEPLRQGPWPRLETETAASSQTGCQME